MKKNLIGLWILLSFIIMGIFVTAGCTPGTGQKQPGPQAGTVQQTPSSEEMSVHILDIGQGDAILIGRAGEWALIDSGDVDHRTQMKAYLQKYGVKELKTVIITHPHADHLGGMYAVFQSVKVDRIYDDGQITTTSTYRNYLKEIKKRNIPYDTLKAGETVALVEGVPFEVLGPVKAAKDGQGHPDLNNCSIVGRITYGKFSMLLTGDAEKEEENSILQTYRSHLKSDVLKVGHHGSRTSSGISFLTAVKPQAAVISAGAGNSYGLPHDITLKNLEKMSVSIYRTDRDGTITVRTDGIKYTLGKEHS